jgi:hypothetical protein
MMSMNGSIRIRAAMSVAKTANVHGQTCVRLDDFVVAGSKGLGNGFGAVGVVARLTRGSVLAKQFLR